MKLAYFLIAVLILILFFVLMILLEAGLCRLLVHNKKDKKDKKEK